MRGTFLLLLALAFCLLAAALAPLFLADPGMVQIRLRGWTVEMSVLVLVLAVLVTWVLIYLLMKLWKLPTETARKVREQRALGQLEKGLLALTEGDWTTAERALQKSTSVSGQTTARYLAAAQAADGQHAEDRADYYLEQADSGSRRKWFLVELTRARLMTENGRFEEALPILEVLHSKKRRHQQVLGLLARCYTELGKWQELQQLLPLMQKAQLVDEVRADELKHQAAVAELGLCRTEEQLESVWQKLPRSMRKAAPVARAYAEKAIQLGQAGLAEPVLRASLKQKWESGLLVPYGAAGPDDVMRRLKQCEKWMLEHPEDASLHLALGRLCAREELWGKARHHMVRSLEIEPTIGGYDSLGQLLDRKGELELAMASFRNALRMSQGEKPLPLPADVGRLVAPDA